MTDGRTIAHLDMDAFYVAVELLRHPELVGRPLIIAGGGPRAVVTTASYEARPYGVGSAMPVSQALRLCPDLARLPVDMGHYRAKSSEVMALVGELGAPTQRVSLDEVYLDLSAVAHPVDAMSALVRRIRERLGLDASVGIGPSKLVAKVASDADKPRGFCVLTREAAMERFASSPPTLIPGIGPKTGARLRELGVPTLAVLRRCTLDGLIERFGESHGRALHDRARFLDDAPVTERTAKSRSVESTFDRDVSDRAELERVLAGQAARLGSELRRKGVSGRNVAIKVRLDDWTTVTRARTLEAPTNDSSVIARQARRLLRDYDPPRPVRLLGVRVGAFGESSAGREPAAGQRLFAA